jgi:hypothetical protein
MKMTALKLLLFFVLVTACHKSSDTNNNTTPVPDVYKKIYGATDMYVDGNYIVIKSNGRPDHKSPYYQSTQWASTLYEAYNGSNASFVLNPNRIATSNLTFRIPMNPVVSASPQATPLGPIGIALNGVPFFNQYAAGGTPLTNEVNSFDQYNGHPQMQGSYHYHIEPTYLTTQYSKHVLLGFLLDGFPVYGPLENNATITNSDLDAYHGHTHATAEFPNGIYHYHFTDAAPYLNGSGFKGTAGTVTQ